MAVVVISRDDSIRAALEAALDKLPLNQLAPERRVAVKPNDT